jgi:hypothetical protein
VAEGSDIAPPKVPVFDEGDRTRMVDGILDGVGAVVRSVSALRALTEAVHLRGGWVYAAGRGSLADPASTLHRRDRVGIHRTGSYISVDTGKYSIAPWLAREVAAQLA